MYSRNSRNSMMNSLKMKTNKTLKKMVNIKQQLVEFMTHLQEDINENMDRILEIEWNLENREPISIGVFATIDNMNDKLVSMVSEKKKLDQTYNKLHNAIINKLDEYKRLTVRSHSPVRKSNSKTKKKYNSI